jgi:hypothetical protein
MVAEGGVAAAEAVEALDGLEGCVPCLGLGAEAVAVDELALEGGEWIGISFLTWAEGSPAKGAVKIPGGFRIGSDGAGVCVVEGVVENPEASGRGRVALPGTGQAASIDALGGQVQQDLADHLGLGDTGAPPSIGRRHRTAPSPRSVGPQCCSPRLTTHPLPREVNAMMRISAPHRGQTRGSTSSMRRMSCTQRRRRACRSRSIGSPSGMATEVNPASSLAPATSPGDVSGRAVVPDDMVARVRNVHQGAGEEVLGVNRRVGALAPWLGLERAA